MKIKFLLLIVAIFFSSHLSFAKCNWNIYINVYNDGVVVNQFWRYNISPFYSAIDANDSLRVIVSGDNNCWDRFLLIRDADTLYNGPVWSGDYVHTFNDTGHYVFKYQNSDMITFWMTYDLYVSGRIQTGIESASGLTPPKIYPVGSSGIYHIESGFRIKAVKVFDIAGRIFNLNVSSNFSEIDMNHFSSGVYFYIISDERENVWRGKLMKN